MTMAEAPAPPKAHVQPDAAKAGVAHVTAHMPPYAPLKMRRQRFDEAPDSLVPADPPERSPAWRAAVFGPALIGTAALLSGLFAWLDAGGMTWLEWTLLGLIGLSFVWVALSVSTVLVAAAGLLRRRARCNAAGTRGLDVALLVPVYNENPSDVFGNAQAMLDAFRTLQMDAPPGFAVHYRRRAQNTDKKVGNIEDWITGWGAAWEAMLVLDADSLMAGRSIVALADELAADPRAGLVQSFPTLIGARTLFARIQQFSNIAYGWLLAEGLALWSQTEGNYWGHNAIIRTRAFAAAAGLPHLPGDRLILSHDFVEAGLLRRAGWRVRFLPRLAGSYEETPASLIDHVLRDRRWCRGNLQHLRLLGARGLHPVSRFHLFHGAVAYLLSPAWFLLLLAWALLGKNETTNVIRYFSEANPLYPNWPVMTEINSALFLVIMYAVLLTPKLMGAGIIALHPKAHRIFGGRPRFLSAFAIEVVLSILYAPILMIQQCRAVLRACLTTTEPWAPQRRGSESYPLSTLLRFHWLETVLGLVLGAGLDPARALGLDLGDAGETAQLEETEGGRVTGGLLMATRSLAAPSGVDVAGLGAIVTSSQALGATTITRGHDVQFGGQHRSIQRYYDIIPATNSGLDATLVFHYNDAELGGLPEEELVLFRSTDEGFIWRSRGFDSRDPVANTVTLSGIDAFSRWTLGATSQPLPVELTAFEAALDGDGPGLDPVFGEAVVDVALALDAPVPAADLALRSDVPALALPPGVSVDNHLRDLRGGSAVSMSVPGQLQDWVTLDGSRLRALAGFARQGAAHIALEHLEVRRRREGCLGDGLHEGLVVERRLQRRVRRLRQPDHRRQCLEVELGDVLGGLVEGRCDGLCRAGHGFRRQFHLGLHGLPTTRVENACAAGGYAPRSERFAARASFELGGTTLELPRGWAAVDATVAGRAFTFVNTHLEPAESVDLMDVATTGNMAVDPEVTGVIQGEHEMIGPPDPKTAEDRAADTPGFADDPWSPPSPPPVSDTLDGNGGPGLRGGTIGQRFQAFDAIPQTGWIPPDPVVTAGPDHLIEAVNSGFTIYTKLGNERQAYTTFDDFFDPRLPTGWAGTLFDPKVVYSTEHDKYVMMVLGVDRTNQEAYAFVAVSQTTDPTGNWWQYRFAQDAANAADSDAWWDYASMGADTWGVYLTGNFFLWAGGYKYSVIYSLPDDIFTGAGFGFWKFWNLEWPGGSNAFALQVAHPHSVNGDEETFFVNNFSGSGSQALLWRLSGDRGNSPSLTRASISTPAYNAIGQNIGQPDGEDDIDGGDARILNAVYSNRRVWAALTTDPNDDGNQSGFMSLVFNTNSNTLVHDDRYWTSDLYYYYPAITLPGFAVDESVAYGMYMSASDEDSVYPSGLVKIYEDPLNDNSGTFVYTRFGQDTYRRLDSNNRNRWGDYFAAAWDWTCDVMWGVTERSSDSNSWRTHIESRSLTNTEPGCQLLDLLDPRGGEFLQGRQDFTIEWDRDNLPSSVDDDVQIWFDDGGGWDLVVDGLSHLATQYTWQVPNIDTTEGRIWVGNWNSASSLWTIHDLSPETFTISRRDPDLEIINLNGPGAMDVDTDYVVDYSVLNAGDWDSPSYEVTVRLYRDAACTIGSGELVGSETLPVLSAGFSTAETITVNLPTSVPTGGFHLCLTANESQAFYEDSYTENTDSYPLSVTNPDILLADGFEG